MPIPLADLSELMVMALLHHRYPRTQQVSLVEQHLTDGPSIRASRVQSLSIRRARRGQAAARDGSPIAVLCGKSRRSKEGSAIAAVPEHSRSNDATRIARQVRPAILV